MLAVFNQQSVELGVECQQVNTYTVYVNTRLEFLLKHFDGLAQHLILERFGIDDEKTTRQQQNNHSYQAKAQTYQPFKSLLHT